MKEKFVRYFAPIVIFVTLLITFGLVRGLGILYIFTRGAEQFFYNFRMVVRGETTPNEAITIIGIDKYSLEKMEQEEKMKWQWDRSVYGVLLDKLVARNPKVVAIDIWFDGWSEGEEGKKKDQSLIDSINRATEKTRLIFSLPTSENVPGFPFFRDHCPHIYYGIVEAKLDQGDDVCRRALIFKTVNFGGGERGKDDLRTVLTLPLSIASLSGQFSEEADQPGYAAPVSKEFIEKMEQIPVDNENTYFISYCGPGEDKEHEIPGPFDSIRLYDLYKKDDDFTKYEDRIKDKIVLIGATRPPGKSDVRKHPFSFSGEEMSGIEIIANSLNTVLEEDYLYPAPLWLDLLFMILLPMSAAFSASYLTPWKATIITAVLLIGYFLAAILFFALDNTIFDMTKPILPTCISFAVAMVLVSIREKIKITGLLPDGVGDMQKIKIANAAIFFIDIRDSVKLKEQMGEEIYGKKRDEFFGIIEASYKKRCGTIIKYTGDGAMGDMGGTRKCKDFVGESIAASLELLENVKELNRRGEKAGLLPFKIGIGLFAGESAFGFHGGHEKKSYDVLGSPVDLASRVESQTKELKTPILFPKEMVEKGSGGFDVEEVATVSLKGRTAPVTLLTVKGLKGKLFEG